ncbi:MAG TPA: hypothetical protein VIY08_08180 [Candidatus Nitrosocosmicus sp.]
MNWIINFEVECTPKEFESKKEKLYSHHCTLSAEPPIKEIIFEHAEMRPVENHKNILECKAMVFHKEDEQHFKNYVDKVFNADVEFFHEPFSKRMNDVFNVTKFTPIIIFVVLFIHETIVITFHMETNPWILALIFSIAGATAAFVVDFIAILKDHY